MKITETRLKSILLSGAALGYAAMPGVALAQDQDAAQDADNVDSNVIIVTASKRETTLQEIPIAVSVTSGEDIEDAQVRDLIDLADPGPLAARLAAAELGQHQLHHPRLRQRRQQPRYRTFGRRVHRWRLSFAFGCPDRRPSQHPARRSAAWTAVDPVRQERIGRHHQHRHRAPAVRLRRFGRSILRQFRCQHPEGRFTGPISETLAFSIAGNINKRDGYARDLNLGIDFNDRDRCGVRGQLLWEPSSDLSFRLIGDYDKIDENCCIAANIRENPAITDALRCASGDARPIEATDPFSYRIRNNLPSNNEIENYGASLQGDWNIGDLTLTSITAYREVRSFTNQDSDFTTADLIGQNARQHRIDTFTQEVRIASDFDGPLNFLLGGFYFDEKIDFTNDLSFGAISATMPAP